MATNPTTQAGCLSSSAHLRGTALRVRAPRVVRASVQTQVLAQQFEERFRLDNLAPEPGARRKKQRVGRGYGAGQVYFEGGNEWGVAVVHHRQHTSIHITGWHMR